LLGRNDPVEKFVVYGHSVTDLPDVRRDRIGIDTGAYLTNNLTCLVLEGTTFRFLAAPAWPIGDGAENGRESRRSMAQH
jgi:serine/threonine protein phosphatase 1